jgi:hypothetical protein
MPLAAKPDKANKPMFAHVTGVLDVDSLPGWAYEFTGDIVGSASDTTVDGSLVVTEKYIYWSEVTVITTTAPAGCGTITIESDGVWRQNKHSGFKTRGEVTAAEGTCEYLLGARVDGKGTIRDLFPTFPNALEMDYRFRY